MSTRNLKRDTKRRFAFIETSLYWGLGITARLLGDTFELARQNAHASIDAYRKHHPDNLVYNPSSKRHEASEAFTPKYVSSEAWNYLNYLRGNSLTSRYWEDEEWNGLPVEDVNTLFRPYLERDIVSKVISAIQNHRTLQLDYHSKAMGREQLNVSPNQLAYAGGRYHVRAYCYDNNRFIDLVPSRILHAQFSGHDWVSSDEDHEWNTYVELCFAPNPALPTTLRETLLLDYRLEKGLYTIKTRLALKLYVQREMQRLDWQHNIPLWTQVPEETGINFGRC